MGLKMNKTHKSSKHLDHIDIFSLRDTVINEYQTFAKSFTKIYAKDIRNQLDSIYADNRFWPEPLIQINPSYAQGASIEDLIQSKILHPRCGEIFKDKNTQKPLNLYRHQEEAIAIASSNESYVVTTGTGSGKSLCFFIPIVNRILQEKERDKSQKTRAIIIYPMNALANSQFEEINKFLENIKDSELITVGQYTGQEDEQTRNNIANNPPDILLTNFMMLEYLLTRQAPLDKKVISNCHGLLFLALDELHTYRGRQGADVAILVRRVREMLAPKNLQCIGTSATMASEGTLEDKKRVVASVATKIFATEVFDHNIISESLERTTDKLRNCDTVKSEIANYISNKSDFKIPDIDLKNHPLAIWVETKLGITYEEPIWVRAKPLSLNEAAKQLSMDTKAPVERCRESLKSFLLAANLPESERCNISSKAQKGFFAFKLHQFISGAGNAFATLQEPGKRVVTVDGQQFLPGEPNTRLYSVHFCRLCGQEYHPVRIATKDSERIVYSRDIEDAQIEDSDEETQTDQFGFVTLKPRDDEFDFTGREDDFPENWLDFSNPNNIRIKREYQSHIPITIKVSEQGVVGKGNEAWFIPGAFRFCLRCRNSHTSSARDRNRLASLSAEGRSSATTVLTSNILRWMHSDKSNLDISKRKLLGFTDNRQDAALQAGHFNDFIFVSLLRSGFLAALKNSGKAGLNSDQLGLAMQNALGFVASNEHTKEEWMLEPELRGAAITNAEKILRAILAYRVWFDQRRGWRYTNPNLEELDLVSVSYIGLDDLATDESLHSSAPDILANASIDTRKKVYKELFDYLRLGLAVKSSVLDSHNIEQLKSQSYSSIRPPWGFGNEESPRSSRWLLLQAPSRRNQTQQDEDAIIRGGWRSRLGKLLRSPNTWDGDVRARDLRNDEYNELLSCLLENARLHGLVCNELTTFEDISGWKLLDNAVAFSEKNDATRSVDKKNAYFIDLYSNLASMLQEPGNPLFSFEAREHTAQVDSEKRKIREKRFRFGLKEQEELSLEEEQIRAGGEQARFLPVLFCSPTMELGVDISALNTVYMRNMPPTPANYAQRSGRAGRSGQAALVITYCAARSPHDQYFFKNPKAMVHGEVRAPMLDLTNRDLIESHLHAVWLSSTAQQLSPKISEILDVGNATTRGQELPVKDDIQRAISAPEVTTLSQQRMMAVLNQLATEIDKNKAPWFTSAEALSKTVSSAATNKFNSAFDRWRHLLSAAEQQKESARKIIDDRSAPPQEKNAARSRHNQALNQIDLLLGGSENLSSDFYTYRYLATEGFLPGYNFPRLPLMAYIPSLQEGRTRQTYLQRPRFLALSEFGPRSLVYHEGRAFRVVKAMLSLNSRDLVTADVRLPTQTVRICKICGAGHFDDQLSLCHSCNTPLNEADIVRDIFRIENVATLPAERISANDEERQRQGFELQTVYQWATRDSKVDKRELIFADDIGTVANLVYGPAASITRLNKGLRRRANRTQFGYRIDPISGYWAKNDDEQVENDVNVNPRQWVVPAVQDRKNALFFQPDLSNLNEQSIATLQHALLRGIEDVFQLEEGEILAEPMPNANERTGFLFYEATEGGAGVLTRLVTQDSSLPLVAKRALEIMHFELSIEQSTNKVISIQDQEQAACVAACYRCVMSYYNQPEHDKLDRRERPLQNILIRLANSLTKPQTVPLTSEILPEKNLSSSEVLSNLRKGNIPIAEIKAIEISGTVFKYVWPNHYVIMSENALDTKTLDSLQNKGFEVVYTASTEDEWNSVIEKLKSLLGV